MRSSQSVATMTAVLAVLAIAGGLPAVALPRPATQADDSSDAAVAQMQRLHDYQAALVDPNAGGSTPAFKSDVISPEEALPMLREGQDMQVTLLKHLIKYVPTSMLPDNDVAQYTGWQACGVPWVFARSTVAAPQPPNDARDGTVAEQSADANGVRAKTILCTSSESDYQTILEQDKTTDTPMNVSPTRVMVLQRQQLAEVKKLTDGRKLPDGAFCVSGLTWQAEMPPMPAGQGTGTPAMPDPSTTTTTTNTNTATAPVSR